MHRDESLARSNEIDEICDRFEHQFQSGEAPSIEQFLAEHADLDRTRLFRELLLIELEFRRQRGETPSSADFTARFPDQTDVIDDALQTIATRAGNPHEAETVDVGFESADETHVPGDPATAETVTPAPGTVPQQPSTDEPGGKRFGDHELLHEIARGGMGVVYKARQVKLNRIVALKMIKSGELAGDEEVQRFQAEAEAAARLDHPGIVPIYEVGEWRAGGVSPPVHFFSMGFVDGHGLDARLKDGPLPPGVAAELIRSIAEAVQYAHDKGIVHRDLKPANVLLDADGTPKITDFGLAKNISADSGMTATGQVMGTPSYMPPEQAAGKTGQIGPLADVYSLGAMLYAMLTGRPPFQAANVMETLKQVLEQEPVSPHQLNHAVDQDLETICLKCLEKDATKRYASAGDFAADVVRYLEQKPIVARPIGRPARVWRWCKRNPLGATVAGLLLFLAIAGPAVAIHQIETNRQLDSALAGEKIATATAQRKERETAEALARVKVALANEQAALVRKDKALVETEAAIDRYVKTVRNAKLLKEPRFIPLLKDLLKDALAHYQRFVEEHENEQDEKTQLRMANAFFEIGVISGETGARDEAIKAYQQAGRIFTRLARDQPTVTDYQANRALSHNNVGILYAEDGRPAEALAAYLQVLAIWERLTRDYPAVPDFRYGLARSHNNIGVLYKATGKPAEALAAYQQALKTRQRLTRDNPSTAKYLADLALNHNNIGVLYSDTGNPAQALAAYRQALKISERLTHDNPGVMEFQHHLALSYNNIGALHRSTAKPAKAMAAFQQSLKIFERLAHNNPVVTEYQSQLATNHSNIGELYGDRGQQLEALAAHRQALTIRERLTRENPQAAKHQADLASSHVDIGKLYYANGKPAEALAAHQQALKIQQRLARDNPAVTEYSSALGHSYNNIGNLYQATGKPAEALTAYQRALELRERLARHNPTVSEFQNHLALSHYNIGLLCRAIAKPAEAMKAFQHARKIQERLLLGNPAEAEHQNNLASTHNSIGALYDAIDKPTEALAAYRQAVRIRERLIRDNPAVAEYRNLLAASCVNIGVLYRKSGKPTEALSQVERAVEILTTRLKRERPHPQANRFLRNAHWVRGGCFDDLGRHVEAAAEWRKALQLDSGKMRTFLTQRLCRSLAHGGEHTEATKLAAELLKGRLSTAVGYDLAGVFALSARAAERSRSQETEEHKQGAVRYAERSLAILRALARSGLFRRPKYQAKLRNDPDLNPIRHRNDFRQFARSVGLNLPAWAQKPRSAVNATVGPKAGHR